MRELSGLEYSEIAAAFGISPGAAKQTVHEADLACTSSPRDGTWIARRSGT